MASDVKAVASHTDSVTGKTTTVELTTAGVTDEDTVVFDATLLAANTTYSVVIAKEAAVDQSIAPNKSAEYKTTITTPATVTNNDDKDAPKITLENSNVKVAVVAATAKAQYHTVSYEVSDATALDFASIRDTNNYTFAGKALPAGTVISTDADDAKDNDVKVTIHIPKNVYKVDTKGILTVQGIKDTVGNTVKEILTSKEIELLDGVAPVIKSAFAMVDGIPVNGTVGTGLEFTIAEGAKTSTISVVFDEEINLNGAGKVFVKVGTNAAVEYGTVELSTDKKSVVIKPLSAGHATMGTENAEFTLFNSDGTNAVTEIKDAKGNELTIPAISVKVAK